MKQQALAELLELSQGYVSKLESGRVQPHPEVVDRIHALLSSSERLSVLEQIKAAIRHSPFRVCLLELSDQPRLACISDTCRGHALPFDSDQAGATLKDEGVEDFESGIAQAQESLLATNNPRPSEMVWSLPGAEATEFMRSTIVPIPIPTGRWFLQIASIRISREEYRDCQDRWGGKFNSTPTPGNRTPG